MTYPGGKWITRIPFDRCKQFGCSRPYPRRSEAGVGSVWECECGTRWKIIKWNSDQRDGDYPSWEKILDTTE